MSSRFTIVFDLFGFSPGSGFQEIPLEYLVFASRKKSTLLIGFPLFLDHEQVVRFGLWTPFFPVVSSQYKWKTNFGRRRYKSQVNTILLFDFKRVLADRSHFTVFWVFRNFPKLNSIHFNFSCPRGRGNVPREWLA